jgi:hypothetical protein
MAKAANIEWKIGDYAKHRGFLVRLTSLRNPTSFDLVSYYDKGVGITCGGHTMLGGDHVAKLQPVSDARDLLIMRGYIAVQAVKDARAIIHQGERDVEIYTAALKALDEARGLACP